MGYMVKNEDSQKVITLTLTAEQLEAISGAMDIVGIVLSASVIDESLVIEVDIDNSFFSKTQKTSIDFYLCPAFLIKNKVFAAEGCFVDDLECVGFGIVDNPQDKTLTKIET